MKKTAYLALLALVFLSVPSLTQAGYTVVKGDCLSIIGQKTEIKWQEIANANGIKKPWIIYPGQKLEIPSKIETVSKVIKKQKPVVVKKTGNSNWIPGSNPWKGGLEEGIRGVGISEKEVVFLAEKVRNRKFSSEAKIDKTGIVTDDSGNKYSMLRMGYGNGLFLDNPKPAWEDAQHMEAGWIYNSGKEFLLYPFKCWNPTKIILIEIPPVVVIPPEPEIQQEPEKPVIIEEEKPVFILPEKTECPIEHEPIVGAGIWGNHLAEGRFLYGEYVLWLKEPFFYCDSEYSLGLGLYANWEDGESKLSAYKWDAWGIGAQVGIKRTWWEEKDMFRQWQIKGRALWEEQSGGNSQSGYWMEQNNIKLGLYGEYEHQFDERWIGVVVAEGWLDLNKDRVSSWAGDQSETREMFGIGAYGQYKFDKDWSVRFGGGPFYQGWDELFGLRLSAEARWRDRLMFGPSLAIFPFGLSDIYEGIYSASDLTTLTGFIRYEFGPDIRELYRERRMESIKKRDQEMFGTI